MQRVANIKTAFWQGGAIWLVDALAAPDRAQSTDVHAHHAIQLVFTLGGWFELSTPGSPPVAGDVVAVAPDAPHLFRSEGLTAILFIEPESRAGRAVQRRLFRDAAVAAAPTPSMLVLNRLRACQEEPQHLEWVGRALIGELAADATADVVDPRIEKVIALAAHRIEDAVALAEAAREVGLSTGRLRHLFVEQTGLPFRTYLLWLRLNLAVTRVVAGASLTEAAHDAGFSDSAHFSRTFRRMFGMQPAALRLT